MSNRDYKSSARPARSSNSRHHGKSGGGLMAGLLIGLIVGVGAVVGVTMYLNRASTPFSNLQKQEARQQSASEATSDVTLLAPGSQLREVTPPAPVTPAPVPDAVPQTPAAPAPAAPIVQAEGDRFDFYKILPGKLDAVPGAAPAPEKQAPPVSERQFSLQAGAFANEGEADNLKAKLALMGVEASIHSVETANGLLHRVRIGPFSRQTDAERVRSQLKAGGVAADLIKP